MRAHRWWLRLRTAWPLELALLAASDLVYERIRALAPTRSALAQLNADRLLRLEPLQVQSLETWLNRLDRAHHWLAEVTGYYYLSLHLPVTAAVLAWLWWRRPTEYRVARTALLLLTYGALVAFWLLPVAPPRLVVPGSFDTVAALHLGAEPGQTHGLVNEYAAFPSLHVAWAVWCAWVLAGGGRHPLRRLVWLYPLATSVVVLATANHYLVDVLAGVLAFALARACAEVDAGRLRRRPAVAVPDPQAWPS